MRKKEAPNTYWLYDPITGEPTIRVTETPSSSGGLSSREETSFSGGQPVRREVKRFGFPPGTSMQETIYFEGGKPAERELKIYRGADLEGEPILHTKESLSGQIF